MQRSQWVMDSKIGKLYLVASEKGLHGIFWKKQALPLKKTKIIDQALQELKEYFDGKRKNFEVPLVMDGTAFQKRVWKQLRRIPYGQTCSYKDVANRIKNTKAVRAVGGANGKNPVCIIVPCHRVIAADGTLGGYSGRAGAKSKLLELERAVKPAVRL